MKNNWREQAEAVRLSEYVYDLPNERIAKYPLPERDQSKLLLYKNGEISHERFFDLSQFLPESTLLVFNNTKVIPARAHFRKETGALIELLLLHPEKPTRVINEAMLITHSCVWKCMIGNKKKWKTGDSLRSEIVLNNTQITLTATFEDQEANLVRLHWGTEDTFLEIVKALGEIPLPPYLHRESEESDKETYQTVYARQDGAVAAPTAGLHFTDQVLSELAAKNIGQAYLTLHVGAGTFQPIKASTVTDHKMHSEQVVFTSELIASLIENAGNIVPVGTTSLRSLESLYWYGVKLFRKETTQFFIEKLYPYPFEEHELPSLTESFHAIGQYMDENGLDEIVGETEIFIFPGYTFRVCKGLVTNFHQPGSTLILLVAALVGDDWKRIYQQAFDSEYRFLSYGDSSLLWGKNTSF